jgi:uncharacterized coiled-coil protein SlyX
MDMPSPDTTPEQRLEQIESHLAHLERLYDELNQVVVEQAKTLHRLQAQERRLGATMEALELERIRSTNAKPPHYSPL